MLYFIAIETTVLLTRSSDFAVTSKTNCWLKITALVRYKGIVQLNGKDSPMARTRIPLSAAEEETRTLREKLDLSTAEIGLTVRTTNCLEEKGIFSVRDLLNTTRSELLSINNFGEKTLEEVYESLEKIGFCRTPREVKPR